MDIIYIYVHIYIFIYIYIYIHTYIYIYMWANHVGVCVWNIWTDVKLLLRLFFHVSVCCSISFSILSDSPLICMFFASSIAINFQMIQQGNFVGFNAHLHVLCFIDFNQFPDDSAGGCRAQWRLHPTKLSTCAGSRVWSTLCTCFFHLRIWPAAKPRTAPGLQFQSELSNFY